METYNAHRISFRPDPEVKNNYIMELGEITTTGIIPIFRASLNREALQTLYEEVSRILQE